MTTFIKIILSILILQLFVSCGGSDYEEGETQTSTTVANGTEACVQAYYDASVVPQIKSSCGSCHYDGGTATASDLIFPNTANYNDRSNYAALKTYVSANPQLFVNKLDGTVSHNGGTFTSDVVAIMQNYADFTRNVSSCIISNPLPIVSPIPISAVSTANYPEILNMAAQVMLGRAATSAELASVSNETTLDTVLDSYMNDDAFYDWIKFSFNEFLFTDKYIDNNDSVVLLNNAGYATAAWYSGDANASGLEKATNYGITRAPLELIANVVKKDGSFGEILTANYLMVNPFSAKSYGLVPPAGSDQENFVESTIAGIPHAGILTDTVFLNRIPTTRTNVNRERASKVMRWFLNTDILELANRAISSNDQAENFTNPTLQNPNCAVCHKVMDPVTGAFKNWDDFGRFQNPAGRPLFSAWPSTSGPIGFSLDQLIPADQNSTSLQWLATKIVADTRFARSSVNLFYKALTSRDFLKEPSGNDSDYVNKMQAYIFQDAIFRDLVEKFTANGLKAKYLIKALIKSPLFAASNTSVANNNEYFGNSVGLAQLITPEQLDVKLKRLIGYSWTDRFDSTVGNENGNHHLLESSLYLPLYGGIDSDSITSRPGTFNGVMASIQSRMAIEMGCYSAPREFFFNQGSRKLLKYVEVTDQPNSNNITTIENIKKTIAHLHQYLLGEEVNVNSPEVLTSFALLYNVHRDGLAAVGSTENSTLPFMCDVTTHPDTGVNLGGVGAISSDANYTIRAWSALLTYLLSDYRFIYNSNSK